MDYKDYYATLGIKKGVSEDEIQKAYRKLARKYHPDVNRAAGAEDRFKEITEAYEVLKDPEKRRTYDQFGSTGRGRGGFPPGYGGNPFAGFGGATGGPGGGQSGFSSFFDMLFNQGGAPGQPFGGPGGPPQGGDQQATIELTLEEAARGGLREVTLSSSDGENKTYQIKIPAGIRAGQKIRLAGKGSPAPFAGAPAGDLYLEIKLAPHPLFELDELDLRTDLKVSPWEAALGCRARVPTLNGSLEVKIPPGSPSGRQIRLRERGFPRPKGSAGDLFATLKIVVPTELTDRERELFEQLSEASDFRPRPD